MNGQPVHDHHGHDHGHHHDHAPGHAHVHVHAPAEPVRGLPPAPGDGAPSLLMHSARSRVAAALATLALLWLGVAWALMEVAP